MLKKYIEYYKNNPQGYWFKRKVFGWGWTPVRWQGWLVLAVYLGVFTVLFTKAEKAAYSASDTLGSFTIPLIILTAVLLVTCYIKGEKPKWQWGINK